MERYAHCLKNCQQSPSFTIEHMMIAGSNLENKTLEFDFSSKI